MTEFQTALKAYGDELEVAALKVAKLAIAARNDGLEEAAKVAESHGEEQGDIIAADIRKLLRAP